eukprot:gb/GECH01008170.1/.p1 GENE.gb/GECH01008170.1/~~gb/GECH01008170.1/.p1  ORF type:complete len:119 (+),score=8.63 gb/GECH01008170.1/:1-357(+)
MLNRFYCTQPQFSQNSLPIVPWLSQHELVEQLRTAAKERYSTLDLSGMELSIDVSSYCFTPKFFDALNELLEQDSFKMLDISSNPCGEDISWLNPFLDYYPNAPVYKIKTNHNMDSFN